jgi:hypothetical protein
MAAASVEVALLGGYAVVTWGVPRATFDVDLLVLAGDQDVQRCLQVLEQRGFGVDPTYRTGWRDRIRDMPLVKAQVFRDGRTISSDLFPVTTPLQRSAFARARTIKVHDAGIEARVVTAADLVLFELMADRPKDRADVQNVLIVQGIPDPEYLKEWAAKLGMADRLSRALADAGLGPSRGVSPLRAFRSATSWHAQHRVPVTSGTTQAPRKVDARSVRARLTAPPAGTPPDAPPPRAAT